MRHETTAEERFLPREGPVDELVHDDETARCQFLPEGAAGGDGDHVGAAGAFQCVDVGAVVDLGRTDPVATSVTRQKDHPDAMQTAEEQIIGR